MFSKGICLKRKKSKLHYYWNKSCRFFCNPENEIVTNYSSGNKSPQSGFNLFIKTITELELKKG